MNLSIITPHFNDLEGLQQIYQCLGNQSADKWEWIIVDDLSELNIKQDVETWCNTLDDARIKMIFNFNKTNASVCRNIGSDLATNNSIVFLDSDDEISENFVANRQIEFTDFAILKNTAVIEQNGNTQFSNVNEQNYLNCYLKARFLFPITAILWNKTFFNSIGKFHPELPRLQDVELGIRGLQNSSNYKVIDNEVDFYYRVVPIRTRKNFVKPVCDAVHLLISELLDTRLLNTHQLKLLSGYYFLCVKYLERSESTDQIDLVFRNLKLFYKKKYINFIAYVFGYTTLKLYTWQILNSQQFLRINRHLFKPKK